MTESKKLQSVSIISIGTRGDIQPYVAIALALRRELNVSVRLLTNEDHKPFVESFQNDIKAVPIFGDAEKSMKENPLVVKSQADGDAAAFFKAVAVGAKKDAGKACANFLQEMKTHRPDLLICGTLTEYYELYASIAMKVPTMKISLNLLSPNPKRAPFGLPTLPFGLHDYLLFTVMGGEIVKSWNYKDDAMEALPGGQRIMDGIDLKAMKDMAFHPDLPQVVCRSPMFQPIFNPGIDEKFRFVGAAIVEKQYEMKHSASFGGKNDIFDVLTKFIDADHSRKPVYMGWGSMTCKSPEHMVVLATDALRKSNQRGIILGGWAQLSQSVLEKSTEDADLIEYAKKNILFVDKAPHEWLLPKTAAAVHHGGAGTTNASMRSGVPTIITPVFTDQFDNAYLVEQLGVGVGFSKQFQKVSVDELASAIETVTSKDGEYGDKAKELSEKLLQEGGASAVASQVESFWSECVTTGLCDKRTAKLLKKEGEEETNKGTIMLAAVGMIGVLGAVVAHQFMR